MLRSRKCLYIYIYITISRVRISQGGTPCPAYVNGEPKLYVHTYVGTYRLLCKFNKKADL